ncbi:MAG: 2-hydroxychromene-2-carboxylate isomerase [Rhizobiales bacterium TMED94]|nr:disulfide bond formation protein DsbA [Rhodobiaceae bacterium]RPF88930.1 MAG: 2-hydroxychromene-2-carboxylate isomerase [Rhizobiales bacterium TMED94]|tara:strand:+ start:621 stop:1208 length:588 start_codon:yes stop_codon:yes gene_type:complete
MVKNIEFHFDFGSPTAYLAFTQLKIIAERNKTVIEYYPILLGGVFKATGNNPPASVPAKGKYMMTDLQRYADKYRVPYERNPFFPVNTLSLMRGAISYQDEGDFIKYIEVMFKNMWIEPKNLNDEDVLKKVLIENNFDFDDFIKRITDQNVKNRLISNTENAVKKGAFGAPTIFVGDQMFFGQDRMEFVEEYLNN